MCGWRPQYLAVAGNVHIDSALRSQGAGLGESSGEHPEEGPVWGGEAGAGLGLLHTDGAGLAMGGWRCQIKGAYPSSPVQ